MHSIGTHDHNHEDPYEWITENYRLRWRSDLEQLAGDPDRATSGNAYSWIKKGLITQDLVGSATRVLDIGCGWGRNLALVENAIGLDISWPLLRTARTYVPNPLLAGDCYRLPFRDGVFDAVVMTEVIEHLEEPESALHEAARVLEPKGKLILSTPNRAVSRFVAVPGHLREFHYHELRDLLRGTDFRVISRSGSTIPYPPRYNPISRRLDAHPLFFRSWKRLNSLLSRWDDLKWDLIVLARPV